MWHRASADGNVDIAQRRVAVQGLLQLGLVCTERTMGSMCVCVIVYVCVARYCARACMCDNMHRSALFQAFGEPGNRP